MFGFPTYRDN